MQQSQKKRTLIYRTKDAAFCIGKEEVMEDATSLVLRAKDGDVHAFAGLYAQIYKDLYRFAVCTLQNLHDAEDAEQHFVCNQCIKITAVDECKNTADNECDRKEKRQQGR